MILVLDNYDSFTYNLVQQLGHFTSDLQVFRNDALSVAEIMDMKPERIVISPGPGLPSDAGNIVDLIRALDGSLPILGICLGHQAIAEAYGGRIAICGDEKTKLPDGLTIKPCPDETGKPD